ncbi:MAG TPA: phenylalanine 4-monooxygenase [Gammaproteobacteria bacterium]|jgi:phenylalanine-4-hydroxylase|nr:phenylalanine 4-monooxygenase [Gammaproteobacteria bacterium]
MAHKKQSTYTAKPVDEKGFVHYTDEENQIWSRLIKRQIPIVKKHACEEYVRGIELLNFSEDRIPQCEEVSKVLSATTGWMLEPVPALIPFNRFFQLLANRKFPAATFIRRIEELDYLQEPDIFHEVFGHCPLLTNQAYADFTEMYGKLALSASDADRVLLARLYWFTIEFGLIQTNNGLRVYGGGILSSASETPYALESSAVIRKPFDVMEVLRTPYRIDIVQPLYFVIKNFDVLFELIELDLISLIQKARALGMYPPIYNHDE